jgi:hypothetical protein
MTDETAAPIEGQAAPIVETKPASWTDALPEDLREYVGTKGFADPAAALTSYRNLEKLRGVPEDRLLKLPEKLDAEGALDPIYDRLGRPKTADAYTKAIGVEDDVFKAAASTAHKLGLSDAQFKGLQGVMSEQATRVAEAQEAQAAAAFDAWRGQNSEGFNNAARLMAGMGMSEESLAGLLAGDKVQLYDFMAKVAARSAEGSVIHGQAPQGEGFGLSPAAAKSQVAALFADKAFMAQYTSRDDRIRNEAIKRMEVLQVAAAKGGN